MKRSQPSRDWSILRRFVLSLFLALAILAAALPRSVQAQENCRTFHLVKEGETKPYIAHTYNLRWRQIATANDMNPADKVTVGQRLCIPQEEDTRRPERPAGDANANIQISIAGSQVFLNLSRFSQAHVYLVKARDVNQGVGGWSNLGMIQVPRNQTFSRTFTLPSELRGIPILSVCLKDQTTDELICRRVVNP